MDMKIATLNLCLGLKNKKDMVKGLIIENKLDILCVQEIEVQSDVPRNILSIKGFNFEAESNSKKARVGIYIKDNISYQRREDLEGTDLHLLVVDLNGSRKVRIINVYRSFNPTNGFSPRNNFIQQLVKIKNAFVPNTILLGDFNLDYKKQFDVNYGHKLLFDDFDTYMSEFNLIQLIDFNTWSRMIGNIYKSSILDHIYTTDPTCITDIHSITPIFGDHVMICFNLRLDKSVKQSSMKRDWRSYSKTLLCEKLAVMDWTINDDSVQGYWNCFENKLIGVVDVLVPLVDFVNNNVKSTLISPLIRNKLNKRKRFLKKQKTDPTLERHLHIKTLNKEIKNHFFKLKRDKIRRGILPGNSKSLWSAVNLAKDINIKGLPETMFINKVKVAPIKLADSFGSFFHEKVANIVNETEVDPGVYNGVKKITCQNEFYMSKDIVKECVLSLKIKNSEGFDRIPQRILSDGVDFLCAPLAGLFMLIYSEKSIPEQWLVSKIILIHKKGPRHDIENYRPIANLCSSSKIFEKLILKRIQTLQELNAIDLTGKQQHGFKKKRNTASIGLVLQSLIARALDESNYVLMASLDLSSAFDIVNVKLLIKRLRIIGLPGDVVDLIEVWLRERFYYVDISGDRSNLFKSSTGTIQGSILGPFLYAVYVSPIFDICNMSNFADDNFVISWSKDKNTLVLDLVRKLEAITKWLRGSGLKVNENKTELCLFYRIDTQPVVLTLNNTPILSKTTINVLGVIFDSKLQWAEHIAQAIKKANSSLHAIRMIKGFFSKKELLELITANYYSILYYNSDIWHIPSLKPALKQLLLSASAKAIKVCMYKPSPMISFIDLHKLNKRATPNQLLNYKHALLLYNIYNENQPSAEWLALNFNQIITSRQTSFQISKLNNYKVGLNILSNRLAVINKMIPLDWLALSKESYKVKCKKKFIIDT